MLWFGVAATCLGEAARAEISLPARLRWVIFRIVSGRVVVLNGQYGQSMSKTRNRPALGRHESFVIDVSTAAVSVRYQLTTDQFDLTAEFVDGQRARIYRQPRGNSPVVRVQYDQPEAGQVTLSVGSDESSRQYFADSFWHLMLAAPEDCTRHLISILEHLRSNWHLQHCAEGIKDAMFYRATSGALPDRKKWTVLVAALGSDHFHVRRHAERELSRTGQAIVPFLKELGVGKLDAEQRFRVRRILAARSAPVDDTPDRVAAWLIDDRSAWLTLATADDPIRRELAAAQLSRLVGRRLDFDPQADRKTRGSQIERLRRRIGSDPSKPPRQLR